MPVNNFANTFHMEQVEKVTIPALRDKFIHYLNLGFYFLKVDSIRDGWTETVYLKNHQHVLILQCNGLISNNVNEMILHPSEVKWLKDKSVKEWFVTYKQINNNEINQSRLTADGYDVAWDKAKKCIEDMNKNYKKLSESCKSDVAIQFVLVKISLVTSFEDWDEI